MSFGLAGAPATFQRFIHVILNELLDLGVIVYLGDILVYSRTRAEHKQLLFCVFVLLQAANLSIKPSKCKFFRSEIEFVGILFSGEGAAIEQSKLSAILNWPRPTSVSQLQSFLGFTNFCCRFIPHFGKLVKPLNMFLRGNPKQLLWSDDLEHSFLEIKEVFSSTVVLPHPDPAVAFELAADASDYAMGVVLRQNN
jgi:Reverse transcriptase (RNA-dependent DNA polymerase)/RNase H-like domain found in reverse transcriptase